MSSLRKALRQLSKALRQREWKYPVINKDVVITISIIFEIFQHILIYIKGNADKIAPPPLPTFAILNTEYIRVDWIKNSTEAKKENL
jgi:hypothetical protein